MKLAPACAFALLLLPIAAPARADEKSACIAAAENGQTLRKDGKLVEAGREFLACGRDVCPAVIRSECATWLDDVTAATPSVVFSVVDPGGREVVDADLLLDGVPVPDGLRGKAVLLDPGPHTVKVSKSGFSTGEATLAIREGEKARAVTIALEALEGASPDAAAAATHEAPARVREVLLSAPPSSARRWPAVAVGGVGGAAVSAGAIFGILAAGTWSDAKSMCGAGCAPGSPAHDEQADAQRFATLSTIGFVSGAVLLVGAGILYFTSKPAVTPATAKNGRVGALGIAF